MTADPGQGLAGRPSVAVRPYLGLRDVLAAQGVAAQGLAFALQGFAAQGLAFGLHGLAAQGFETFAAQGLAFFAAQGFAAQVADAAQGFRV